MAESQSYNSKSPDNETQEALIYGSSYPDIKGYEVELDHCAEIAERRIERLIVSINGLLARELLEGYPSAVCTDAKLDRLPDISGFSPQDVERTIGVLREILRYSMSKDWILDCKSDIRMAGRLIGACEHSVHVQRRHSDDSWRQAANRFSQKPISSKRPER